MRDRGVVSRRMRTGARSSVRVIGNVVAKDIERRAHEADHPVGVVARSATFDDFAPRRKALDRERRVTRALSQQCEILRERRQAKGARTALAGALIGHPSNDSLGFAHGAAFAREHNDDSGAG